MEDGNKSCAAEFKLRCSEKGGSKVTDDPVDAPAPEPVKKPRKPRASDPAADDAKAGTADQDPQQDTDVDQPGADDDGGTEEPAKDEPPHVEKHKKEPQAAAEPVKQSGTGSDKMPRGKSDAGLMRFRRKPPKRRR